MRPMNIPKTDTSIVVWSKLAYLEDFPSELRPTKAFFQINWGPQSIFPPINMTLRPLGWIKLKSGLSVKMKFYHKVKESLKRQTCSLFHRFKSGYHNDYFWVNFYRFHSVSFLEAAGAVAKICSSFYSNHYKQIKLAWIGETHCKIKKML